MPLVNMKDMLQHAYRNSYAVGAFDLVSLDFLDGIMAAAEQHSSPVILSLAESHFDYFDFDLLMPAVVSAAKRATIPVAIHLDHGATLKSAIRAINLGCNGVMVDASHQTLDENIETTSAIVKMAHGCGVPVEGELGYVPGVEGEDAERHPGEVAYTTAEEAKQYFDATCIDFLAISIGTVHGRMKGNPKLDFERLDEINSALKLPLVIHGGTGLSDEQFRQLIVNGVAKINYYTALSDAAANQVRENVQTSPDGGFTNLTRGVSEAITEEVGRCMLLWGSSGHANSVLAESGLWTPVEHLIIYNVTGIEEQQARAMIAEGESVLSTIPGVLEVVTGQAVKPDADYRYTWLVRFCHPAVIDSYRDHPLHVAFADNHFRPVAGGRISIDYQAIGNMPTAEQ